MCEKEHGEWWFILVKWAMYILEPKKTLYVVVKSVYRRVIGKSKSQVLVPVLAQSVFKTGCFYPNANAILESLNDVLFQCV
mmetsp:Transcript_14241/g.18619  ORF Transcript_14241/g.18619 Transcript_14241/m.18619 type:complete len:81 (+) Transcript_14241:676-918(+)